MAKKAHFCVHCGKPVGAKDRFCQHCGKPVQEIATNATQAAVPAKAEPQNSVKKETPVHKNVNKNAEPDKKRGISKELLFFLVVFGLLFVFRAHLLVPLTGMLLVIVGWTLYGLILPKKALFWKEPTKRSRGRVFFRGLISSVLVFTILVMAIASPLGFETQRIAAIATDEEQLLPTEIGVNVKLPAFTLEEEEELVIAPSSETPAIDGEITKVHGTYDITLGDRHSFDGFLEIDIPFDPSEVEGGTPEEMLEAKYLDESTGSWEPVITEVHDGYVRLYLDHLTKITLVETTARKVRPSVFVDESPEIQALTKQAAQSSNMEDLERLGWSRAMNLYGFTGSGVTISDEVLKFSGMGNAGDLMKGLGVVTTLTQVVAEINDGDYESATFNSIKGFLNYAIAQWGSAALNVAGVGIFFIDYSLNTLGSEAQALREGMLEDIYRTYYQRNYRRPREWYDVMWQIANTSASQEEMKNRMDAEIDAYTSLIWNDEGAVAELQAELQGHGWTFGAGFTEEKKQELERAHREMLIATLQPVITTVEKNLRNQFIKKKVEAEYRALNYLEGYLEITVALSGGTPDATIKSELLDGDNVVSIAEPYLLENPYTGNDVAYFSMRRGDFIALGMPDRVRITQIPPEGESTTVTHAIEFRQGWDGVARFSLDAPMLPDEEEYAEEDFIEEDQGLEDNAGTEMASNDNPASDLANLPREERLSTALQRFFEEIEPFLDRQDQEATQELQLAYDRFISAVRDDVTMAGTTGVWQQDFYFADGQWQEDGERVASQVVYYLYKADTTQEEETVDDSEYVSLQEFNQILNSDGSSGEMEIETDSSNDPDFSNLTQDQYNAMSGADRAFVDFVRSKQYWESLPPGDDKDKAYNQMNVNYRIYQEALINNQ